MALIVGAALTPPTARVSISLTIPARVRNVSVAIASTNSSNLVGMRTFLVDSVFSVRAITCIMTRKMSTDDTKVSRKSYFIAQKQPENAYETARKDAECVQRGSLRYRLCARCTHTAALRTQAREIHQPPRPRRSQPA